MLPLSGEPSLAGIPIGSPSLLHDICADSVGCLTRLHRQYGLLVAFPKGSDLTVFGFGPEANYAVFSEPRLYHMVGPPGPRGSSQRRFQQGLFGLNGAQHLQHRRLFMPALSKDAVRGQAGLMTSLLERSLSSWRVGQSLDLYGAMKKLSLDIAGKLLFGLDEIPQAEELAATFQEWLDCHISCWFAMTLPIEAPAGTYERMLETAQQLEAHFRRLIEQRQRHLGESDGDLLALLLRARRDGRIADAEVIGEMQTLLNASYQTTASALTWSLLLLAQHPRVLASLMEQPQPLAGEGSLLDRVIKESLRILPPVVFTTRRVVQAVSLAGRRLPEGIFVNVSFYVTHHLAEIFPEPERFLPDRWLGLSVSPYAYLPFATGPRMCQGAVFSLQLFQIVIPAILRRFRLALRPGTRVDRHSGLTLGVRGSLPVTLLSPESRPGAVPLTGNILEMVHFPPDIPERVAA